LVLLSGKAGETKVHTIERGLLGDRLKLQFTAQAGKPLLFGIELYRLEDGPQE